MRFLHGLSLVAALLALWPAAASADPTWHVEIEPPTNGKIVVDKTIPAQDYDEGTIVFPNGAFVHFSVPYVYWLHDPTPDYCPSYCSFALTPEFIHPLLSGPPYQNFRVELTAVPDPGWYFAGWTGLCAGGDQTCEIPFAQPGAVSVNFSRCPPGTSCLTVQASPTGLGTLTVRTGSASGPVVGTCATLCTYGLAAGTTAVVTGSGVGGAVTGPWTGCGSVASGACTVTVSGDTRVSTRWQYPLTLTKASPYVALHVYGPSGFLATCAAAQTSCQFLLDPGARVRLQRTVSYPSNNANYRATLGWQGCIADTGNSDACTLQVDGPTSATALYADEIRLQVSSAASGRVTSSPAGIDCGSGSPGICAAWFPFGTDVTLTATADAGWTVAGWNGPECTSLTASCVVDLDHLPLVGGPSLYPQLRVDVVGAGEVNTGGAGIPCSATAPSLCIAVPPGQAVTITKNPRPSSVFSGWSGGGCSGTGNCNVSLSAPTTVTATFTGVYRLFASSDATGSVSVVSSAPYLQCNSNPQWCSYNGGVVVTITFHRNTVNWPFQNWSSDSGACQDAPTNRVCTLVMGENVNAQGEVRAHANTQFGPLVDVTVNGRGRVVSAPSGVDCTGPTVGSECDEYVLGGGPRTFTATPAPGWTLTSWAGICSGSGACTPTLNTMNPSLTATFADVTGPVATLVSRTPADGAGGWNTGAVTVTWSCADVGSGVVAGTVTDTVSGDGADQTAEATCTDLAGNDTVASEVDVDIDGDVPVVTATASRAPDRNGWYRLPFGVTWSASAISGEASCDPTTLYAGPDAATGTLHGDCTSGVGASAQASFAFKYDPTPPTLVAPPVDVDATDGTGTLLGSYPGVQASDVLSAVELACQPALPHLFAIGSTPVSCTATDAAGNTTTRAFAVRVGPWPDLTLAATGAALRQGGSGTLELRVGNAGTGATSGPVTLVETLPAGLTVQAIGGAGWSCDAASATCTRSDALVPGTAYPPVLVDVVAAADAPGAVVAAARVSGGGEAAAREDDNAVSTTIAIEAVAPPTADPPPTVRPPARAPTVRATARLDARARTIVARASLSARSRVVLTLRTKAGRTVAQWTRTIARGTTTVRLALPRRVKLARGWRLQVAATAAGITSRVVVGVT